MRRAISIKELYDKERNKMNFEGEFKEFIGNPEMSGSWFIWGQSANGKTMLAAQLAKYLTKFGKVAYNSLEEGDSDSLKIAFKLVKMEEVKSKIVVLDKEFLPELIERLVKRKSPKIIFIDSFQYFDINKREYKQLISRFRNKLFIFTSHADGKHPSGRAAASVKFDANVKIWVEGFKAFPQGRYGGGKPYTIWQKGAEKYWGQK